LTATVLSKIARVAAEDRELRGDAGVGDHDVKAAEALHGLGDRRLDPLAVAHVALHHGESPHSAARLRAGRARSEEGEPRSALVQAARDRGTDAARGAGYQDSLSSQGGRFICHGPAP